MEIKYLEIHVDFSTLVTNHIFPGKETSEFYDTIRSEFEKFSTKLALNFPGEYQALKQTLLEKFKELFPYKVTDYSLNDLERRSALEHVIVMIFEGLIIQNLKESITNFCQQYHTLPSLGQVFTLYNYETYFQAMLTKFSNMDEKLKEPIEWILQEYNFMLVLVNYFDPDNEDPADKNGILKFYFGLHHSY